MKIEHGKLQNAECKFHRKHKHTTKTKNTMNEDRVYVNPKGIIMELSEKLARNLVSISFKDNHISAAQEILIGANSNIPDLERFIVVIGTGTSKHAHQHVPLGKDASHELKKKFLDGELEVPFETLERQGLNEKEQQIYADGIKIGREKAKIIIKKLFEDELDELSQVYKLDKEDFETNLLAISKYYPKKLIDELATLINFRYYPDKFHEILAHLFKNRFIDAIINFNFDEILDQAIKDEIGSSEYRKILFDGDVPSWDEIFKDGHLQKPIYIKPHGTFSHKTSMRFTRRDYFNISSDINLFLGDLLSGNIPDPIDPKANRQVKVNLLVFGFNMESFEFNNLLKEKLPKDSTVYIFDNLEEKNTYKKDIIPIISSCTEPDGKKIITNYVPWRDKSTGNAAYTIDDIIVDLFDGISDCFKTGYKPIGIDRHLCIADLFQKTTGDVRSIKYKAMYCRDRTYIEIAMQVAESKGFISLAQLTNDRAGRYYNLYKKYWKKYHNCPNNIKRRKAQM